jgi:two-component system OmpR family response regulator
MHILLVEDDKRISDFVIKGLEENHYQVTLATTGAEARDLLSEPHWDIILMDIMLPGIDGIQLIKLARYRKNYVPILILSALGEASDRVLGLDSGADDYLTKPFHFEELLSRIKALTRRIRLDYNPQSDQILRIGELEINLDKHSVEFQALTIDLSPREFKLLVFLAENPGRALSRTKILNAVWGYDYHHNTNIVDVYISYLRRKLDVMNAGTFIRTIKGVGYMLTPG